MEALVIAWVVLFVTGLALLAIGSSLYMVPEFDWVFGLGYMCIMGTMVVGVLMIFA